LHLLVSVRDRSEVSAALEGGADVIDAKEPDNGSLGPVSSARLRQIDRRVPGGVPLSVALGDFDSPVAVAAAIAALPLRRRAAPVYLKLGLGPDGGTDLWRIVAAAVEAALQHPAEPRVIVVEYADRAAKAGSFETILSGASVAGAHGLLVDTLTKNGRTLLDWWPEARLSTWINETRAAGLLVAVAGSLGLRELRRAAALGPDVIGVRGAACSGGRSGTVEASRVEPLRAALRQESVAPAANRKTRPSARGLPSILK
jgi:(5-formylfuran-3-yl)methyl phosphate synthase